MLRQQVLTEWNSCKEKLKPLTKIIILTNDQKKIISDLENVTNGNFTKGEWFTLLPSDHPKWKEYLTKRKQPDTRQLIDKYLQIYTKGDEYKW